MKLPACTTEKRKIKGIYIIPEGDANRISLQRKGSLANTPELFDFALISGFFQTIDKLDNLRCHQGGSDAIIKQLQTILGQ